MDTLFFKRIIKLYIKIIKYYKIKINDNEAFKKRDNL